MMTGLPPMICGRCVNWRCSSARAKKLSRRSSRTAMSPRDLLMPYGDVVMVLSIVLRIKRSLDGTEIDEIIRDVETRKALAVEQQRRAEWRKSELAAERFRSECHADAAALPRSAPDRMR